MGMTDYWEADPRPFYHLSTHEGGTHRMGEDPRTSVVDTYGETHECKGLYAIGGGQFPTYVAYNPTTTIMAMAFRTAEHLVGKLPQLTAAAGAASPA
jgi:gluconate 2-dehydrogenase alpha chain